MYYSRFTKVIINHFMSKDQSIPRRNKVIPKPKYVRRSTREKIDQAPKSSPGKRLKAINKVAKLGKKKLPAKGLQILSEVALSEAEQMKITESNKVGDDFVHPKLSTFDEEERYEEKLDEEEDGSDQRFYTPSLFESTYDEAYDEVTQGDNVEEGKLDEEKTNEEEEVNELYNDVNINLEGRDTKITDALSANVQATQVIEYTHVIMIAVTPEVQQKSSLISSGFISTMLNPNPDTDRLRDEAQAENKDFINKLDENIKKIIKDHVKVQVKEQVYKILPRIEKLVNEQLEAKVLTH
nr:hypothetical protein [Tanacetum cinerariifolium]